MPEQWELKRLTGVKPGNMPVLSVMPYTEKDRAFQKPGVSIPNIVNPLVKKAEKLSIEETCGTDSGFTEMLKSDTFQINNLTSGITKGIIVGVIVGAVLILIFKKVT